MILCPPPFTVLPPQPVPTRAPPLRFQFESSLPYYYYSLLSGATNKKQPSCFPLCSSSRCSSFFISILSWPCTSLLSVSPYLLHQNPVGLTRVSPMRIRKRQVPLPLSSLSPVPLPDPHLLNLNHCSSPSSPPLVLQQQQQQLHDPNKPSQRLYHVGPLLPPQPSNHPNRRPIRASNHASDSPAEPMMMNKKSYCSETLKGEEDQDGSTEAAEERGNDTRKGGILGAETVSGFHSESSSSSHRRVLGRLFEGDKAFPFKKRRGSVGEVTRMEKEKRLTQTKMEKKCDDERSDDKKQEDRVVTKESPDHSVGSGTSSKKRARGNPIMEGSRCSRVNGRGWRCCQQTLVGYSLCEHHLGKGRLRSLNSVRSRAFVDTKSKQLSKPSCLEQPKEEEREPDMLPDVNQGEDQRQEAEHGEAKKPLVVTKKRMKLGIVKARSMSSLLGQTTSATAVDDENNK